jgi:hypothetical protein
LAILLAVFLINEHKPVRWVHRQFKWEFYRSQRFAEVIAANERELFLDCRYQLAHASSTLRDIPVPHH